ncbi:Gfo/Idh/MocA family oxidoreductase [Kineosporia sp. J2-2]|uniref:Gfo/Idh/MocA family oxidoreductase n=1 Tax=Kineosporia corallincola TaxID=2835133 RepID=A0ABS5TRA1_9ACTN|nr:Gfo/Idh/MocA family oxidoreductase [Kineosporia corallincola]MBT0773064.1 Gfo/Idh/MocA family oxidoreductase [Kineosporia corallincola]
MTEVQAEGAVAPLRWGIIGTGGIAARFAADTALLDGTQVTAVGSRTVERAAGFAADQGIPAHHGSYQALVADPSVDAVYVATPHPFHAEHALLAIAAGKHVLVEKPFTMNAVEARTVVEAARRAGVFCMEAMWTRFLPHMTRLRELLAEGAIGEVLALGVDQGMRFQQDPEHRLFAFELGGGALLDLGIYPFSFASMVFGAPQTVRASASPAFTGVDGTTSAVLTYGNGAHAVILCSATVATPMKAWIAGTEGRVELDRQWYSGSSAITLTRADGSTERFEPVEGMVRGNAKGMRYQVAEAVARIRAGELESPVMPLDETISIMGILDEVRDQIGLVYPES